MSDEPLWIQPRKLADFEPLRPAEQKLLDERDTGLLVVIGDGNVPPDDASEAVRVRASFLRWLILGAEGAEGRTHEKGVQVCGAFIESDGPVGAATRGLDLWGCKVDRDITLMGCRFAAPPRLLSASLHGLFLNDSHLPGLMADRLAAKGSVFLRQIESDDEVRLLGARIDGDLSVTGAALHARNGKALNADGLVTGGSVFLNTVESHGAIRLLGARIAGYLDCTRARLRHPSGETLHADGASISGSVFLERLESDGEVRFLGARIGGDLDCTGATLRNAHGDALALSNVRLEGGFLMLPAKRIEGAVDLRAARLGPIRDNPDFWPGNVNLDRCTYDAFINCPTDAAKRIAWLDKDRRVDDHKTGAFRPQPWEQCAKVLRETGHAIDARAVLIAKERRQRQARRAKAAPWLRGPLWVRDFLLRITVRYGRVPMLAFAWLFALWIVGGVIFDQAERAGALRPVAAATNTAWVACGQDASTTRLECWVQSDTGAAYPRFNPLVYSLDLTVPVVDFQMARWWSPDEGAAWPWAAPSRWWKWVQIALGWALSLLAVAGFSGLVKSD